MNDYEIDFVVIKNGVKKYIQVTYLLSSDETIDRELRGLLAINDNFEKYVISMDPIVHDFNNGIIHQNIETFLLSDF